MLIQPALLTSKPYRQSPNVVSGFVFYLLRTYVNGHVEARGQMLDLVLSSHLVSLGVKFKLSGLAPSTLTPRSVSLACTPAVFQLGRIFVYRPYCFRKGLLVSLREDRLELQLVLEFAALFHPRAFNDTYENDSRNMKCRS